MACREGWDMTDYNIASLLQALEREKERADMHAAARKEFEDIAYDKGVERDEWKAKFEVLQAVWDVHNRSPCGEWRARCTEALSRAEKAEEDRNIFAKANHHQAMMINGLRGDAHVFRERMAKQWAIVRGQRASARIDRDIWKLRAEKAEAVCQALEDNFPHDWRCDLGIGQKCSCPFTKELEAWRAAKEKACRI